MEIEALRNSNIYIWRTDIDIPEAMLSLSISELSHSFIAPYGGRAIFTEVVAQKVIPFLANWPAYSRYKLKCVEFGRPDDPENGFPVMELRSCLALKFWIADLVPQFPSQSKMVVANLEVSCNIDWIEIK